MEQLQLPYAPLGKIATRKEVRQLYTPTSREIYKMPLNMITERGSNSRIVYEGIEELADNIFLQGHKEPLVLDVLPDGKGILDEGHRRYRAFNLLVKQGRWDHTQLIAFYRNSSEVTELDRMVRQITSNTNLKKDLKPYEKAKVVWNVKHLFSEKPKTHEEVAELLHLSRQSIDNFIRIAEADDRMKQEMITADMNLKDCLALVTSKSKLDKQSAKAEIDANKNRADKPAEPFDPNAKELAEFNKIAAGPDDDDFPFKEETPEQQLLREQEEAEKEMDRLLLVADEVKVAKLSMHLGKKLAAAITVKVKLDDEVEKVALFLNKDTVLDDDIVKQIQVTGLKTAYLYKPGCEPVAPSVITEAPAKKEKDKYDMDRPEIAQIQNIIKLSDKLDFQVGKLNVPDGAKKDISDIVKWMQKDAEELREWIHSNKKQNKRGS